MSNAGAQTLPLEAGGPDPAIVDPLCVALADYLGWWIRNDIGDAGIEQRPTEVADVLPAANVFGYDPRQTWAREAALLPSLYVWWPEGKPSRIVRRTGAYTLRERDLHIQYVLAEIQIPKGSRGYSGLTQAVDAAMVRALADGYHPGYAYAGDALGTPIAFSLAAPGYLKLEYVGGKTVFAMPRPTSSARAGGDRETLVQRAYPMFVGIVKVWERIDRHVPENETLTALNVDISVDPDASLPVLHRVVEN
jgi:hypothetical protein